MESTTQRNLLHRLLQAIKRLSLRLLGLEETINQQNQLRQELALLQQESALLRQELTLLHQELTLLKQQTATREILRQETINRESLLRHEIAVLRQQFFMMKKSGFHLQPRPHICIVSLHSYPLFNPDCYAPFGGSEVRISLLAKELARRGLFEISMIVFDHGQPVIEQREGITFYTWAGKLAPEEIAPDTRPKACSSSNEINQKGIPSNISQEQPDWSMPVTGPAFGLIGDYVVKQASVNIYDQVDADLYLMPGNHSLAAELAYYCQKRGKKYIFLAGSDGDFDPTYKSNSESTNMYGYPGHLMVYAIENASVHIVQSHRQAELLWQAYHRTSLVIRNPVDLSRSFPKQTTNDKILWVGKADPNKRPEIVLDLARQLPQYFFTIIVSPSNPDILNGCIEAANHLPNVMLMTYIPFQEVEQYFAEAKLFVNTSLFEGFPNTFLQAAKYGVPVISLQVDPGGMLSEYDCGLLCQGNFESLKQNVQLLMSTPTLYTQKSSRCLEYIHTYHDKDLIIPQYEKALVSVLQDDKEVLRK